MKRAFKTLLARVKNADSRNNFQPEWYAILFKPQFIIRRSLFIHTSEFAKNCQKKRILDVGCGEMPYRNLFPDCEYVGIDIEGGGHDDNLKNVTKYYDGSNIPFGDNEFDVVIFTEVLEHTENPEKIVSEINRVLKRGGMLYLTIPFVADEHEIPFDFRRLTTFGLRKLLGEHHFANVKIEKTSGVFGTIGQLSSTFLFDVFFKKFKIRRYYERFIIQKVFLVLICFPIQSLSLILDEVFKKRGISLNYIVTAQKT